jgi:hypothetical protein
MVDQPNWTEVATAWGTIAAAIAAGVAAIAAAIASWLSLKGADQWRRTIEEQRIDECVAASRDLEGILGRLISIRKQQGVHPTYPTFEVYDRLWDSWRRLDAAFSTARRYRRGLAADIPQKIRSKFHELELILKEDWRSTAPAFGTADQIQVDVGKLLQPLYRL